MGDMVKIPDYMARMVGKGKMSDVTVKHDYPLLFLSLTNLQNDEAVGAYRYNFMTHIPSYMKHMVGNVEPVEFCDTVETKLGVRRVRTPAVWVLNIVVCDADKEIIRHGKKFVRDQVSTFTRKFFEIRERESDFEESIAL